jgi:hypothetical protein
MMQAPGLLTPLRAWYLILGSGAIPSHFSSGNEPLPNIVKALVLLLIPVMGIGKASACWEAAGQAHGVDPLLLYAVAQVESGIRPLALNKEHVARTRSVDIGIMQINSRWLPHLKTYGITEGQLSDGCTNIHVGSWILGDLIRRYGNSWHAVGAYNTACTELKGEACLKSRRKYAWKVFRQVEQAKVKLAQNNLVGWLQ